MNMNLLIPYVKLPNHIDPLFTEFTYGDGGSRGRRLRTLTPGDHVFFHTTIRGKKYITAFYEVARVMDTNDVVKNHTLSDKYANPHILNAKTDTAPDDDVIVFGDPITSRVPTYPLLFDRPLARRLSLDIPFPKGRTDSQAIGSATRSWRKLTNKDVQILQKAIAHSEKAGNAEGKLSPNSILSTEEVSQVVEKHIEGLVAKNPNLIRHFVTSVKSQVETDDGRIDLLLNTKSGEIIVVEVKLHRIGRDAVKQLQNYMHWIRKGTRKKNVSGVLVCEGVLPAFEDDLAKLKDIKVMCYGWQLQLCQWR